MKYIILILVILSTFYSFTYAFQNWSRNRTGALGIILIASSAIILTGYMVLIRYR